MRKLLLLMIFYGISVNDFPAEIRKIIYTTNTIENVNRGIRKYTKTKVQFPDDMAAQKAVYMAIMNIKKNGACPSITGDTYSINFKRSLKTDADSDAVTIFCLHKLF